MFIKKTTLLEFDDVAERARINQVFKGTTRGLLLAVLDAMVAGQWEQFRELAVGLPKDHVEFLAEPVFELAVELQEQRKRRAAYEGGATIDPATRSMLSHMKGVALGPESANYPQLELSDGQPKAASAPAVAPRTVRFLPASGVSREERAYAHRSSLYRAGDMVLVWANEGDLTFHERMPVPAEAAPASDAEALQASCSLLHGVQPDHKGDQVGAARPPWRDWLSYGATATPVEATPADAVGAEPASPEKPEAG
jgi:hypothetical protein